MHFVEIQMERLVHGAIILSLGNLDTYCVTFRFVLPMVSINEGNSKYI